MWGLKNKHLNLNLNLNYSLYYNLYSLKICDSFFIVILTSNTKLSDLQNMLLSDPRLSAY